MADICACRSGRFATASRCTIVSLLQFTRIGGAPSLAPDFDKDRHVWTASNGRVSNLRRCLLEAAPAATAPINVLAYLIQAQLGSTTCVERLSRCNLNRQGIDFSCRFQGVPCTSFTGALVDVRRERITTPHAGSSAILVSTSGKFIVSVKVLPLKFIGILSWGQPHGSHRVDTSPSGCGKFHGQFASHPS